MSDTFPDDLVRLAHLYGVQTSYYDVFGEHHRTSPEAVLAVLRSLGAPVIDIADVPRAAAGRLREIITRPCEPVTVAWQGRPAAAVVRFAPAAAGRTMRISLGREEAGNGGRAPADGPVWEGTPEELRQLSTTRPGHHQTQAAAFSLPDDLDPGYYRLVIEQGDETWESLVIAAPSHLPPASAGPDPEAAGAREWGVFMPLYALHSQQSQGIGDLGDLTRLLAWTAEQGGSFVGTLPLLAAFHEPGRTPGPYAPVSRLFFNEVYLDPGLLPELEHCSAARELMNSTAFGEELAALEGQEAPHQGDVMALKRQVLELLADCFFTTGPLDGFGAFLHSRGSPPGPGRDGVEAYVRFRAAREHYERPWQEWPEPAAGGKIPAAAVPERAYRYHHYVQFRLAEQLAGVAEEPGARLYLDYPVGVPPDSFDTWYYRGLFARAAGVGAPPDTFFRKGQNWGFPPLVPDRDRADGYRYTRAALGTHLQYAPLLRFDHIMGLSRLFWIPEGHEPAGGAYVRNRSDELTAVLLLEAHRAGAVIVGEDLGTVPRSVRSRMQRHGIRRMFIVQSELRPDAHEPLPPPGAGFLAALNTHDMPPFAAWWGDEDTRQLAELGHLDDATEREITRHRAAIRDALERWLESRVEKNAAEGTRDSGEDPIAAVMRACHRFLARSEAELVMVALEDLWLERRPQNVPGTGSELPNWRRRSRHAFEEFATLPGVRAMLSEIDALRRMSGRPATGHEREED